MHPEEYKTLQNPENYYIGKVLPPHFACPTSILFFYRSINKYLREKPHTHSRYTLIFPRQELTYNVDGTRFELLPGEVLLIYPFQYRYLYSHPNDCERLYLTFVLKEPQEYLPPPGKFIMKDQVAYHLSRALDFYTENRVMELSFECAMLLKELSGQRHGLDVHSFSPPVSAAIRYMEGHLSKSFTLRNLAILCYSSESNLRLLFKKEVGVGPAAYLAYLRLNAAVQYLTSSRKSIQEISDICGFSSVFAFSHFFKKHLGCSPLHYRKNSEHSIIPEKTPWQGENGKSDLPS